ncbi:phosphoserine phosphatase SerB [Helicobacter himalayensis]|uniref:phosphoserine phosphatase SerB n=1 Tax=Helicobacter himalayensis TaxID=1591088 RepID=UPI003D6E8DC7
MKLAVFDFDSTLMNGETIDFLAKEFGVEAQVAHITAQAMEGKLDYYESLKSRVALLKGLSLVRAKEICENLPLNLGAHEIVQILKSKGYKVVCFSGGFSLATRHFAKVLGLDSDFSNILHFKDDVLSGEIGGEMMFSTSKGEMLVRLQNLLGIERQNTLCVGDGANDLSMFASADTRIAFCAKNVLKEAANIIIDKQDLREIEKYV